MRAARSSEEYVTFVKLSEVFEEIQGDARKCEKMRGRSREIEEIRGNPRKSEGIRGPRLAWDPTGSEVLSRYDLLLPRLSPQYEVIRGHF